MVPNSPRLKAQVRGEKDKKAKELRKQDLIPAILYGHKVKPVPLAVDSSAFEKVFREAGESTLISLEINNEKPRPVLIYEVQRDSLSGKFIHTDFYQVKMTEKVETAVPLKFVGKSRAVEEEGGTLVKNFDEIEVKALPDKLPHEIVVNISSLNTFNDIIHVKDLPISKEVEILADKERVVATVTPPRTKEELEKLEEEVEEKVEEVEAVREKVEGEEEGEKEEGVEGKEEEKGEKETPGAEENEEKK